MVTAVAPIGMRDREAGHRHLHDLAGLREEARADQARPAGRARLPRTRARLRQAPRLRPRPGRGGRRSPSPTRICSRTSSGRQAERFMGAPKRGRLFWDRWLREYYQDRVPVTIEVERVVAWPDAQASGQPQRVRARRCRATRRTTGAAGEGHRPARRRGARGTKARRRCTTACLRSPARTDSPMSPRWTSPGLPGTGHQLASRRRLPPGGRRAGLLGHSYRAQLIGLESRTHTGWLTVPEHGDALYAPHTYVGLPGPAQQDAAATRQRPGCQTRAAEGAATGQGIGGGFRRKRG